MALVERCQLPQVPEWTAIVTAHHNLSGVSAVDPDAQHEQVQDCGGDQVWIRDFFVVASCDIRLYNCHAVHGECACFVGANGCSIAHRLTGIQVADQVIILHHFLKGKAELPECWILLN